MEEAWLHDLLTDIRQRVCGVEQDIREIRDRLSRIEGHSEGQWRYGRILRDWLGWIVGALMVLVSLAKGRWIQ